MESSPAPVYPKNRLPLPYGYSGHPRYTQSPAEVAESLRLRSKKLVLAGAAILSASIAIFTEAPPHSPLQIVALAADIFGLPYLLIEPLGNKLEAKAITDPSDETERAFGQEIMTAYFAQDDAYQFEWPESFTVGPSQVRDGYVEQEVVPAHRQGEGILLNK